jgi:hypothetical protein
MLRIALVVLLAGVATAQIPIIDWDKQKAEILQHHRALIQIDTSNPPGLIPVTRRAMATAAERCTSALSTRGTDPHLNQ